MSEHEVVIVGAGPAGIATAISLQDRGVRPLLVDRAGEIASSWRTRYDRLKLNTGRQFSHLPGRPYPKGTPTVPDPRPGDRAPRSAHSRGRHRAEVQHGGETHRAAAPPLAAAHLQLRHRFAPRSCRQPDDGQPLPPRM